MAPESANPISRELAAFCKGEGMARRSSSWYRRTSDEVIQVLNLQRSQFSPRYYVNLGFWLLGLGDNEFPKEFECHVRIRLDAFLRERGDALTGLLDLDAPVPESERRAQLHAILMTSIQAVLAEGVVLSGLRHLHMKGRVRGEAIRGTALPLLVG